jgi:hypothetical protein
VVAAETRDSMVLAARTILSIIYHAKSDPTKFRIQLFRQGRTNDAIVVRCERRNDVWKRVP